MTHLLHFMLWGAAILLLFWWVIIPGLLLALLCVACVGALVCGAGRRCLAWLLGTPAEHPDGTQPPPERRQSRAAPGSAKRAP